jgi:hypothetical protein
MRPVMNTCSKANVIDVTPMSELTVIVGSPSVRSEIVIVAAGKVTAITMSAVRPPAARTSFVMLDLHSSY